jgi:hypothetical protein
MAQDVCLLFSNSLDLKSVVDHLTKAFGSSAFVVEGEDGAWTKVTITRRKFLRTATVVFRPMPDAERDEGIYKLRHVFQSIPAENQALKQKLLVRIAATRLAIEVRAERGLRGLEDTVFEVANALDALIFWSGNRMLDSKGKLIMDFEGRSGMKDLEVVVDASLLDAQTPVTEAGAARKAKSEAVLKAKKVTVNVTLPVIESEAHARIRSQQDVVGRALALCLVAVKGEGLPDAVVVEVMAQFQIREFLTEEEAAFIDNPAPTDAERIQFAWRYEGFWVMLWALNLVKGLDYPSKICDVAYAVSIIREAESLEAFSKAANLRSATEILDEADLIYRYHWAVVNARLKQLPAPGELDAGVVYERHFALNWLRSYLDQAWDDVRTDT